MKLSKAIEAQLQRIEAGLQKLEAKEAGANDGAGARYFEIILETLDCFLASMPPQYAEIVTTDLERLSPEVFAKLIDFPHHLGTAIGSRLTGAVFVMSATQATRRFVLEFEAAGRYPASDAQYWRRAPDFALEMPEPLCRFFIETGWTAEVNFFNGFHNCEDCGYWFPARRNALNDEIIFPRCLLCNGVTGNDAYRRKSDRAAAGDQ